MIVNPYEMYYELWADGELIYFMAKNVRQADGTYKDTLYSYNSQNDKLDKIWQVPDKTDVGAWDTTGVSVSQWYLYVVDIGSGQLEKTGWSYYHEY